MGPRICPSCNTKDRITYNQLNITQWMAGFCRIMKEESCQVTKNHMLDYLISLLDDSNDFSWRAAKASHAVLLCPWSRVRLSVGQKLRKLIELGEPMPNDMLFKLKLILHLKNFEKVRILKNLSNQCLVSTIMTILAILTKTMKQKGFSIATYVVLALHKMARSMPIVPWTANKSGQKTNNPGHGQYSSVTA